MTEREWEEIQLELQNFSGKTGTTRQTGSTYQWSHAVGEGEEGFNFEKTQVTVRPVDGRTSIRIRKYYDGAVAMYVLAFGLTSFLTLMVAHSLPDVAKLADLLYAGFGGMTSLGVVRALISKSARNYRTKLSQLADRLLQIVDKSASLDSEVNIRGGKLEMPDHDEFLQEKMKLGNPGYPLREPEENSERNRSLWFFSISASGFLLVKEAPAKNATDSRIGAAPV